MNRIKWTIFVKGKKYPENIVIVRGRIKVSRMIKINDIYL